MLTFDVVTTFARHHWETHAQRCVETFGQHWSGVRLMTYLDEDLEAQSSWLAEFKARHANRPTDNYRFDAVRFAHKVAAIDLAMTAGRADALIWLDADCVTHAPVNGEWLTTLLAGADFAYLRRARKYPECGFMIFRRNHAGQAFVAAVVDQYRTDALFGMAEWHDSWVIEQVRARLEVAGVLRCASLSGDAEAAGHPLINGPLGARLDHLKGKRKAIGRSKPTDLIRPRAEAYWSA